MIKIALSKYTLYFYFHLLELNFEVSPSNHYFIIISFQNMSEKSCNVPFILSYVFFLMRNKPMQYQNILDIFYNL